jgi:hypothetical protein
MIQRSLSLGVLGLALGLLVATASAAEKVKSDSTSHSGTVVSAAAGKLVMTGKDNKEHSHDVLATAKIMINGQSGKLEDLKKGVTVTVTTDKDGKVTAISSGTVKSTKKATAATKAAAVKASK